MEHFFSPLGVLVDQVALALFSGLYCQLKAPRRHWLTVWIVGACAIVALNVAVATCLGSTAYVRTAPLTMLLAHVLLLTLVAEDSFSQSAFNVCTMQFVGVLAHSVCVWTEVFLHLEDVSLLSRLVGYAVVVPAVRVFRGAYRKMRLLHGDGWRALAAVPFLQAFSYSCIFKLVDGSAEELLSLLCCLTGLLFYVVLWRYFDSVRAGRESEDNARMVQWQLSAMTERIESVSAMEDQLRRARHDLRHHNRTLAAYARQGDTEGLLHYLEQQDAYERESVMQRFCENETLNNILRVYGRMAAQRSVRTEVLAQAPAALPVRDPDLVAIVANLYENAINGAAESGGENPSLSLRLQEKAGKFVIRCENDCDGKLNFEGQVPERLWGIGMRSIMVAAERYHGECSFTANNGRFVAVVLLDT